MSRTRQKHRQTRPLTAAEYELLDEDFCRTVEVVHGMIVFCDSPSREHRRLMVRLAHGREVHAKRASTAETCFDVAADVDLRLWDVPHYWIVRMDTVGIASVEWYTLDRGVMAYAHMRTFMRDADDHLDFEVPVKISLTWEDLLP